MALTTTLNPYSLRLISLNTMNLISITGGGNSSSPPKINTMLGMENTTVFLAKLALTPGKLSTPIIKIPPKMRTDMWCCCGNAGNFLKK
jgi:hypothetical protein